MGAFVVDVGDGNTPEKHELEIYRDSLKMTMFHNMGLMGRKGTGKCITVNTSLKGTAGDEVTVHFVPFQNTNPIHGQDSSVQGNEKRFNEYNFKVLIDEVNFPFLSRGRVTNQRTILNTRNEMRAQIANHFAQYSEQELIKRLSGIAKLESVSQYEAATETTDRVNAGGATGTGRMVRCSGSNNAVSVAEASSDNAALVAAMSTSDKISPNAIMRASTTARASARGTKARYKMSPLRIKSGKEVFVCFISPNAVFDLMTHPEWLTRAIMAGDAGLSNDPIATASLGIIKNVVVHESEHICEFVDGSGDRYSRNLLLGQDAGLLAWAQTLDYVEQFQDYKRKLGVNGSEIRGEGKVAFTDKDNEAEDVDYGVLQLVSSANDV